VPVSSTARGAEMAREESGAAAIGSALAANLYSLQIVARNIEDLSHNKTRFFVIAPTEKARAPAGATKLRSLFWCRTSPVRWSEYSMCSNATASTCR
jgi:chorismate mutase/prephenate dehydratase